MTDDAQEALHESIVRQERRISDDDVSCAPVSVVGDVNEPDESANDVVCEMASELPDARYVSSQVSFDGVDDDSEIVGADEARTADVRITQTPADIPNSFSFALSYNDIKRFICNRNSRGLTGEWSEVMYRKFHEVYPVCALSFQYNHVRRAQSQKSNSPFWVGRAKCRTGDCVQVTLSIQNEPVEGQEVRVDVEVTGTCQHVRNSDDIVVERPTADSYAQLHELTLRICSLPRSSQLRSCTTSGWGRGVR